jgi:hypothetical protein
MALLGRFSLFIAVLTRLIHFIERGQFGFRVDAALFLSAFADPSQCCSDLKLRVPSFSDQTFYHNTFCGQVLLFVSVAKPPPIAHVTG